MSPTGSNPDKPSELAVILERIDFLRDDIGELKKSVICLENNYASLRHEYAVEHVRVVDKADAAHKRLDIHEQKIEAIVSTLDRMERAMSPLITTNRLILWIGGIFGVSIITLIWMLITQEAKLIFP